MNPDLAPPDPLAPGALRVTALGGIGEIGRNMTVFEYLGRLLIVDCGVLFPGHDEPGVDLILPDLRHIEHRLADVEAHLDRRALKVRRRPGDSKQFRIDAARAFEVGLAQPKAGPEPVPAGAGAQPS